MQPRVSITKLRQAPQRQTARVEWDFSRVGLHNEYVVDMSALRSKRKRLRHVAWEGGDVAFWNSCCV
jgi:hypothetical protein